MGRHELLIWAGRQSHVSPIGPDAASLLENVFLNKHGTGACHKSEDGTGHGRLELVRAAAAAAAGGGGGRRGDGAAEQGAVQEGGVRHPGLSLQEHVRLQEVGTPFEESDCFVSPWIFLHLVHMNWWRLEVFGPDAGALFRF